MRCAGSIAARRPPRAAWWCSPYQHPPVSKYAAGIGAQLADGYGPARAVSALLVALACGLLVFVGRRLFSLRVGVLAGAAIILLGPRA